MNSNQRKTKELLTFHSGCHGNWVTIAMRYVPDAYCSRNLHVKYELNNNLRQRAKPFKEFQSGKLGQQFALTTQDLKLFNSYFKNNYFKRGKHMGS